IYWMPLYEILEERGLEVYLVNARHTKNLPGRKSDVQESQWLLKLHSYGATEQLVPTRVRDSGASNLLAATGRTCAGSGDLHSADAKSPDPDERAIGQRDQRHKRADRTGDHTGDRGRRAQSTEAGCAQ